MELPQAFHRYREEIATELASIVGSSGSALYHMMRYHLGWVDAEGRPHEGEGGKLVRPTLCLLSCEVVGGQWRVALPAAAAVELLHNFSLVHDDIEDGDEERRHRATLWRLWGEAQAINAGDAMHALAGLAMLRLEGRGVDPLRVIRAARILDEACFELCHGQYLDIAYESRFDVDIDAYLDMIDRKTAALIACSFELGALLGTEDEAMVQRFRRLGRKLGLAYQIQDDILGIWGDCSSSDIRRKKKTLPVLYALKQAKGKQREELLRIYGKRAVDAGDVDKVVEVLEQLGAREYCQRKARDYYGQALVELDGAELSAKATAELRQVTAFLMEREY